MFHETFSYQSINHVSMLQRIILRSMCIDYIHIYVKSFAQRNGSANYFTCSNFPRSLLKVETYSFKVMKGSSFKRGTMQNNKYMKNSPRVLLWKIAYTRSIQNDPHK